MVTKVTIDDPWVVRDYAASGMTDKPRMLHLPHRPHFVPHQTQVRAPMGDEPNLPKCTDCLREEAKGQD